MKPDNRQARTVKPAVKTAIKREQADARIRHAERKQVRPEVKRSLREHLQIAAQGYLRALLDAWGLDIDRGYWIGDNIGGTWDQDGELTISLRDIVYCVEEDVSLLEYTDMLSYVTMADYLDLDLPDIRSWHTGRFRRMPPETLERLTQLKDDLLEEIDDAREQLRRDIAEAAKAPTLDFE